MKTKINSKKTPIQRSFLTEEQKELRAFLNQYKVCRLRKRQLEERIKQIKEDMEKPISSIEYTSIQKNNNTISSGAAAYTYMLDNIETRINEQINEALNVLIKITDVIGYLSSDSEERMLLELRYIDCKSIAKICNELHLTRSPIYQKEKNAFNMLLGYERVRVILARYKADKVRTQQDTNMCYSSSVKIEN